MRLYIVLILGLLAGGCGASPEGPASREVGAALPVTVLADSGEGGGMPPARLGGASPEARWTLVRIAPARADVRAALPVPVPEVPEAGEAAPDVAQDDELRPPIARGAATIRLGSPRRGWLELDVRVDENGDVTDALPVGGDADSATVRAAIDAALGLRWYPAMRRGRPVAVWCRQRFETGPGR